MFKLIFLSFLIFQYVTSFGDAAKAWEPATRSDIWWMPVHEQFVEKTKTDGNMIQVVFYGDSITQAWSSAGISVWQKHYTPLHAVNYGIGGDMTQNLIYRMEHGEIDGLHPKLVVLKIGSNNVPSIVHGFGTAEDVAKGIKTIIDLIHTKLPQSKVLLLGILPRGDANGTNNPQIKEVNTIISKYANGNTIEFLNMEKQYEDAEGHAKADLFSIDKVHLSPKGYEVWAETMDPLFKKMIGGDVSHVTPNPWEPEARSDSWWMQMHQRFLEETKKDANMIQVIFYGDSITNGWAGSGEQVWAKHYTPLHAVNYGIGGDHTQHLIWRIENGEVEGLHPKVVVLNIGSNNIGSHSDTDIIKGIKAVIDLLHSKLPQTKILLLGILPRRNPYTTFNVKLINSRISAYDNNSSIRYLDMALAFADSTGDIKANLFSDNTHLTAAGYEVWAATMDPLLKLMLAAH